MQLYEKRGRRYRPVADCIVMTRGEIDRMITKIAAENFRIRPARRLSLNDEQKAAFDVFMSTLPENSQHVFSAGNILQIAEQIKDEIFRPITCDNGGDVAVIRHFIHR